MSAPLVDWYKSTRCADSACVEVAKLDSDVIGLRNSTGSDQDVLTFTRNEWAQFIAGVKAGEFGQH